MSSDTPAPDSPSKPPLRFRRTRIAVSVFFALATVALCVLWVRSYWRHDFVFLPFGRNFVIGVTSNDACLICIGGTAPTQSRQFQWLSERSGYDVDYWDYYSRFDLWRDGNSYGISIPYWFLAGLTLCTASGIWLRNSLQFSIRTLLIATTLVAVVLGLGVWLVS